MGRTCWRHSQPALDQLGHGAGPLTAALAPVDLLQELGLDLLGLSPRSLGLAADLAAEPAFAAGEGVAAGEHLHLEAVAALPDHPCSEPSMSFHLRVRNDIRSSKASVAGL